MEQDTPRLQSLVSQLMVVRTARKEADAIAKQRKEEEKVLTDAIMLEMSAQGIASANLEGLARVAIADKPHYEIADVEAFALYCLMKMVGSFRRGGPLSDGILLQRRISREALESHNNGDPLSPEECALAGVRYVVDNTLTVRSN